MKVLRKVLEVLRKVLRSYMVDGLQQLHLILYLVDVVHEERIPCSAELLLLQDFHRTSLEVALKTVRIANN